MLKTSKEQIILKRKTTNSPIFIDPKREAYFYIKTYLVENLMDSDSCFIEANIIANNIYLFVNNKSFILNYEELTNELKDKGFEFKYNDYK